LLGLGSDDEFLRSFKYQILYFFIKMGIYDLYT